MKIQPLAPQKRFFKVSEKEKPPLLYLSPFVPNTSGGGPVMRAYNHLLALSEHFAVHLVCSAYPVRMNASEIPLEFQECCASSTLYPWVFDEREQVIR